MEDFHPNLLGCQLTFISPEKMTACDVVFMALPTAAALEYAPKLISMGCKVIDLGAAFRLKKRNDWEAVYQHRHSAWKLAETAIYGITELHQEKIMQTKMVANPGCFASAAILGLAPLLNNKLIDLQRIIVNGLSGTAGAGAELNRAAHHPEINNNLIAYNVVDHRHTYEMEQELSLLSGENVVVHFTPTYVPISRGILNICHVFPQSKVTRDQLLEIYQLFYDASPFVKIIDTPYEENVSWQYRSYPWVSSVAGTNYCYIGLDVDEKRNRIVVFSVLDSLGKGGAQVGIENMNLMFGFDRTSGLTALGRHPA